MNTFQIVMLVGAALLALSVLWPQAKDFFSKIKSKSKSVKPYVPSEVRAKDSSLVEIIRCWEHLKVSCEKANLNTACKELDEIFPLFLPKNDKEVV
tara:strand:+ start:3024 stop:3311 length:288 start_codon:yes stop_codon:yes gene_type:complete